MYLIQIFNIVFFELFLNVVSIFKFLLKLYNILILMTQNKLIVSNWKMNLKLSDSKILVNKLIKTIKKTKQSTKNIICPQFLLIPHISNLIKGTKISLGAQDCHFAQNGAFTGESSIDLLKSFKCKYVIIGHSERRENNADSNFIVLKKIKTYLIII